MSDNHQLFIPAELEKKLQDTIFPDLLKGRKDFDLPHTKAVVIWMKRLLTELLPHPELDPIVMVTAAYAHDWGYIGLFDGLNSNDRQVIARMKPKHMERGAELISNLIDEQLSAFISPQQKQRISYLVSVHDKVEQLQTEDEIMIMEADTLGMLDASLVAPTFTPEDNVGFMENEIAGRRIPAFRHEVARTAAKKLVQARWEYYEQKVG